MADTDTKIRKFLFDENNFDAMEAVDIPPVFSVLEMEMAKQEAFEQGRRAGHAEAVAMREKTVADILAAIERQATILFAAEAARASLYEAETLFLARAIFTRLFPGLNERHGLEEVIRAIVTVLEGQRSQPEVIIEVGPDYAPDVRAHLTESLKAAHDGICTVLGNADLRAGECRMRWNDGGSQRSARAICEEISRVFEQTLADRPILRNNDISGPDEIRANIMEQAGSKGDIDG